MKICSMSWLLRFARSLLCAKTRFPVENSLKFGLAVKSRFISIADRIKTRSRQAKWRPHTGCAQNFGVVVGLETVCRISSRRLGCAAVAFQQAAKSLFAANVAKSNCIGRLRFFRCSLAFGSRLDERFVFHALMWSFKMVMIFEF